MEKYLISSLFLDTKRECIQGVDKKENVNHERAIHNKTVEK